MSYGLFDSVWLINLVDCELSSPAAAVHTRAQDRVSGLIRATIRFDKRLSSLGLEPSSGSISSAMYSRKLPAAYPISGYIHWPLRVLDHYDDGWMERVKGEVETDSIVVIILGEFDEDGESEFPSPMSVTVTKN